MDHSPPGSSVHGDSPSKNTGLGVFNLQPREDVIQGFLLRPQGPARCKAGCVRQKASRLFVWIQIRAFSSFLRSPRRLANSIFALGSIISFSGLVHTSAGVDSDGAGTQLGVVEGGHWWFRRWGPAGLELPFWGKDVTQIFPPLGQLLLVDLPGVILRQRLHAGPSH